MTLRLAVWSGPRNISTALMRSWENRSDTAVVDEPLYAYYLAESGIDHPARDEVLAVMPRDLSVVVADLLGAVPDGREVYYQKHMCHHLLEQTDRSWIPRLRNVLLLRDPGEVVTSYRRTRPDVTATDIGVPQQHRLLRELTDAGHAPPVIDAADFLADPEAHLRWLCDWLGVPFDPAMLAWPAGRRDTDGVWAPYWYAAVEASTGFDPPRPRVIDLDERGARVVEEVRPLYDELRAQRLRL